MLAFYLTCFLPNTLTLFPTCSLASILIYFLAYMLTFFIAFYLASFLAFYSAILSGIHSGMLSGIYSGIHFGILSWNTDQPSATRLFYTNAWAEGSWVIPSLHKLHAWLATQAGHCHVIQLPPRVMLGRRSRWKSWRNLGQFCGVMDLVSPSAFCRSFSTKESALHPRHSRMVSAPGMMKFDKIPSMYNLDGGWIVLMDVYDRVLICDSTKEICYRRTFSKNCRGKSSDFGFRRASCNWWLVRPGRWRGRRTGGSGYPTPVEYEYVGLPQLVGPQWRAYGWRLITSWNTDQPSATRLCYTNAWAKGLWVIPTLQMLHVWLATPTSYCHSTSLPSFLAFYLTYVVTFCLAFCLFWRSRLWDLALAVEVRQCPLRSGARGWCPAVPADIWSS